MTHARTGSILASLLLLAPTAGAAWSAFGSHEPDSAYDDPSFMWRDAAPDGAHRVYFAVHLRQGTTELNPNVGLARTRIETFGFERPEAILGVWIDCNRDGYVGLAETALREYSSALLLDDSTCPSATGPTNKWTAGAHNYNGWVSELVPIGPRGYLGNVDQRFYLDPEASVWGDHGLPDGNGARPVCTLAELPAGGARTTGRILDHVDCYLAVMTEERSVDMHDGLVTTIGDPFSWRTRGAWTGSGSPLDTQTFGDADSSHSYVTLTDCDQDPIPLTGDVPVGNDLDRWQIEDPNDVEVHALTDDGRTLAGTVVYATEYASQEPTWWERSSNSVCYDDVDDNEQFYGLVEGSAIDVDERRKTSTDWSFWFYRAPRGGGIAGLNPALPYGGTGGAPSDLGVESIPSYCSPDLDYNPTFCSQTRWYAPMRVRSPPSLLKSDLLGSGNVELAAAYTTTFYAHLGPTTFDRGFATPGGVGVYGAQTCGENTEGVHGGWECDVQQWYPDRSCERGPDGACVGLPTPGWTYHLRDIDCYDGGIADTGLGLMPAFYGAAPCPPP